MTPLAEPEQQTTDRRPGPRGGGSGCRGGRRGGARLLAPLVARRYDIAAAVRARHDRVADGPVRLGHRRAARMPRALADGGRGRRGARLAPCPKRQSRRQSLYGQARDRRSAARARSANWCRPNSRRSNGRSSTSRNVRCWIRRSKVSPPASSTMRSRRRASTWRSIRDDTRRQRHSMPRRCCAPARRERPPRP